MSSFSEKLSSFPRDILDEVRRKPGNERCCDCKALDTSWSSVNHGSLICLDCAGKHRSLGIKTSIVRSIEMDAWTETEVEMLYCGGNQNLRDHLAGTMAALGSKFTIQTLYMSEAAELYRNKISELVKTLKLTERSSSSVKSGSYKPSVIDDSDLPRNPSVKVFSITFGDGPLGVTITENSSKSVIVSKVTPNSPADLQGVRVDDKILSVNWSSTCTYKDVMNAISERPVDVTFCRKIGEFDSSKNITQSVSCGDINSSNNPPLSTLVKKCSFSELVSHVTQNKGKPSSRQIGTYNDKEEVKHAITSQEKANNRHIVTNYDIMEAEKQIPVSQESSIIYTAVNQSPSGRTLPRYREAYKNSTDFMLSDDVVNDIVKLQVSDSTNKQISHNSHSQFSPIVDTPVSATSTSSTIKESTRFTFPDEAFIESNENSQTSAINNSENIQKDLHKVFSLSPDNTLFTIEKVVEVIIRIYIIY